MPSVLEFGLGLAQLMGGKQLQTVLAPPNGMPKSTELALIDLPQERFGSSAAGAKPQDGGGKHQALLESEGMGAVKDAGGLTLTQSEDSCVVYGMPKSAVERGYSLRSVGLKELPQVLQTLAESDQTRTAAAGGSALPK